MDFRTDKEIHIHMDEVPAGCCTTYVATMKAIEDDFDCVHTTLTHFCSWRWSRHVFIHVNGGIHEIGLGACDGTEREIREGHNLEKMLLSHEFDWF